MTTSGVRYKRFMVYLQKETTDSVNSYNHRLWFVVKNITKTSYSELLILSKYYYNIVINGMTYNESIHDKLEEYV
jgi:hypothetical protein